MAESEPVEEEGEGVNPLALCIVLCALVCMGNLWYIYPAIQAQSDCANECNAKLQILYDSCVVQNGRPPNLTLEGNLSGVNTPSPEYDDSKAVYAWMHDNGSLEVLE